MKQQSKLLLKILTIISWIIFIGVMVEAGIFLVGTGIAVVDPSIESYFWRELKLKALYQADPGYFFVMAGLMILVSVARVIMFYLIVRILKSERFDFAQPFNEDVKRFVFNLSYLAGFAGILSGMAAKHAAWLVKRGIDMPDLQHLRLGGADVWLFMAVVLFVIGLIFKRGIEIQTENELTV